MRLLDQVGQCASPLLLEMPDGKVLHLPGVAESAKAVRECSTRYILHDEVAALCTHIAFDDDNAVAASRDIMRAPANQVWLEFDNGARTDALAHFGLTTREAPQRQRIGLLMTGRSDRAGEIRFFWENDEHGPEQAPIIAEFNLDDPTLAQHCDDENTFGVSIGNVPELDALYDCIRFVVEPAWRDYYRTAAGDDYVDVIRSIITPACGDLPMLFALNLLLMTRTALQENISDLAKLNRARQAKGRPSLLDHTELSVNLAHVDAARFEDGHYARAPSRLHIVRGHLVRRAGAVFWRRAHMRGRADRGVITTRTISLRLTGPRAALRR